MLSVSSGSQNVSHRGSVFKITDALPIIGGIGATGWAAYDVYKAKPEEKKEHLLRNMFLLTTFAVVGGLVFKKWLGSHSLIEKLFHKTEGAMEHISVHTAREGSEVVKKAAALRKVLSKSGEKAVPELESILGKTIPAELEKLMNVIYRKAIPQEVEMLAFLQKSLPTAERQLGNKVNKVLNIKV